MESSLFLPVWIALGAVPGALSRYYLTLFCTQKFGSRFPVGTFAINLSGSLLIGFWATLFQSMNANPALSGFVIVGFLGSYTTFSTYAFELSNLLKCGSYQRALLYGVGSPAVGLAGVAMGMALARWV